MLANHVVAADQTKAAPSDGGVCSVRASTSLAAAGAVTVSEVSELSGNLVPDAPAQTTTSVHFRLSLSEGEPGCSRGRRAGRHVRRFMKTL